MPTFTSNDAQINYQTFGDANKPALVFSNSLGTKYSMWQPQIEHFQQDHYVICYDTRGHGGSEAPQGPYSLEQLGQDIVNLLDHLNIAKAAFCGISMGGLTGQWLAIHKPERFQPKLARNRHGKTVLRLSVSKVLLRLLQLQHHAGLPIPLSRATRQSLQNFQTTSELAAQKAMQTAVKLWLRRMSANNLAVFKSLC